MIGGLRVLDLSETTAGAYCTKLLAGAGAEVILVEPPSSGGAMRKCGPFAGGKPGTERSIPFLWFNTGKKSALVDLQTEEGRTVFRNLVRDTDVVVESFRPGYLTSLGLGFDELREVNPSIILASISSFGQTGPYAQFEADETVLYALTGQMFSTGDPAGPPLTTGPAICHITAGLHACTAILMALHQREECGSGGRHIDVSVHEAGLENLEMKAAPCWRTNRNPSRSAMAKTPVVPWGLYRCRDGYAAILAAPFRRWRHFAELFGDGTLLELFYATLVKSLSGEGGPLFRKFVAPRVILARSRFLRKIHELTTRWAASRTKEEIMQVGEEQGLAMAALASLEEVIASPQHAQRGFFVPVDHPEAGTHVYGDAPFKMGATRWTTSRAPLLGEHTEEILATIQADRLNGTRQEGRVTPEPDRFFEAPLAGIRVVDFTHVEAGAHATRVLADYGAEVIRVESVSRLCVFRGISARDRAYDRQPLWGQLHRNKKAVTLNCHSAKEREILLELIQHSDVVVENFRAGAMERMGLGYELLSKTNPGLIMVSMSAYGQSGPYAGYPGYGGSIEAMSGLQNLTARDKTGTPERIREMDVVNGAAGTCAVMMALLHRQGSGEGQHVDLSQMEATSHGLMGGDLLEYVMNGNVSLPVGNRHSVFAPQGCYPCAGDDRWVVITIRSDLEWNAFCRVVGHDEWSRDSRFATCEGRRECHDELDQLLSTWTRSTTPLEAMRLLQEADISAGAVLDLAEVLEDRHLRGREYFCGSPDEPGGLFMGLPFRISGMKRKKPSPGPALGADNVEIVCGLLGRPRADVKPVKEEEIRTAFHLDPRRA